MNERPRCPKSHLIKRPTVDEDAQPRLFTVENFACSKRGTGEDSAPMFCKDFLASELRLRSYEGRLTKYSLQKVASLFLRGSRGVQLKPDNGVVRDSGKSKNE